MADQKVIAIVGSTGQQGGGLARAVLDDPAGLEDTRVHIALDDDRMPTLMGSYKVPHYAGKGEADRFFAEAGAPVIYLAPSFYWETLFDMVQRGEDGVLAITFPIDQPGLFHLQRVGLG